MPVPVPTLFTAAAARLRSQNSALKLHILLDKNSIEVFANDGEQTMTAWIYTPSLPMASPLLPMAKHCTVEQFELNL